MAAESFHVCLIFAQVPYSTFNDSQAAGAHEFVVCALPRRKVSLQSFANNNRFRFSLAPGAICQLLIGVGVDSRRDPVFHVRQFTNNG
jgi:hypothetical protein